TKAELDTLIRYLVTQEQYETVEFQSDSVEGHVTYHLNVGRTRRISKLRVLGAKEFSENQIISEMAVGEKSVFDQQALIEGGDRIRRLYREHGYHNTVIDLEFARLSETEVAVDVKVNE